MNAKPAVSQSPLGLSGGSEATVLRLQDAGVPPAKPPLLRAIAPEDPAILAVGRGLLDEFLDRGSARRLEHYAASHA
jgi:hypothetical protein